MLDRPLDAVGGRGLFVKELDQALYEGRCELTVHSLKDMPLCPPEELPVLALFRAQKIAAMCWSCVKAYPSFRHTR